MSLLQTLGNNRYFIYLFIKNSCLIALAFTLSIMVSYLLYQHSVNSAYQKNAILRAAGVFSMLEEQLANKPIKHWQTTINQIRPPDSQPITIFTYDQLPSFIRNNPRIKTGEIVAKFYTIHPSIEDLFAESAIYKRISNSPYYFCLVRQQKEMPEYVRNNNWIRHMINLSLANTPKQQWSQKLIQLAHEMTVPIKLIDSNTLSRQETIMLDKWGFLPNNSGHARQDTLIFRSPDKDKLVMVGPFIESWVRYHPELFYVIFTSVFLTLLIAAWSIYSHVTIFRLQKLAMLYDKGEFTYDVKIHKAQNLYPLYHALKAMSYNLQQLIGSHKTLTQTLAHELKTPLTKLTFRLYELQNKYHLPDQELHQIENDIDKINHLIRSILRLARYDRPHENMQLLLMPAADFFEPLIKRYQANYPDKNWHLLINTKCQLTIAPKAMTIAIENLLNNAQRYAKQSIQISISETKASSIISIHDDGQGFTDNIIQTFKQPFKKDAHGSGLGIAISHTIVKWHQGQMEAYNATEGGAMIIIKLPRAIA